MITPPSLSLLRAKPAVALILLAATILAAILTARSFYASNTKGRLETACASVLNVVNPHGSTFDQQSSSFSGRDTVVRMLYTVIQPGGRTLRTVILCAFDGTAGYVASPYLIAVAVNGQQLGPARLSFLNRFWLPSEDAALALPSGAAAPPSQSSKIGPPSGA